MCCPSFLSPGTSIDTITTADIGAFVAGSFLHPSQGLRVRSVAGPQRYSSEDIASTLSELTVFRAQREWRP